MSTLKAHRLLAKNAVAACLMLVVAVCAYQAGQWSIKRTLLAPQEVVTIDEAGIRFRARLDTGAVVSSINAHEIEVHDGGVKPSRHDVGKRISFVLINENGERRAVTSKIEQVRGIRTADCREVRYHVYLHVSHRGRTHRVLANLNDRSRARDKLLLGRNWLYHGYAVAPVKQSEI